VAAGDETAIDYNGNNPRHYLLHRHAAQRADSRGRRVSGNFAKAHAQALARL